MIKDKITPKLKSRFREEVQKTILDGKEHGFKLCLDNKNSLFASESCTGTECDIKFKQDCPNYTKTQGNFHTHPDSRAVKEFVFKDESISRKDMASYMKKIAIETNTSLTVPSHHDVLNALINKCAKKTNGTVCTGSDLEEDKIECWTTKDISGPDCMKIKLQNILETYKMTPPKKWTEPFFDKEIIDI